MKGKIRVFARIRPVLTFETQRGAQNVLITPDVLTVEHMWKEKKREYQFDSVFNPDTPQDTVRPHPCFSQDFKARVQSLRRPAAGELRAKARLQVFEDTKHLVQSAVDGYNVCIFAYGQTGSGKTYTIYGDASSPGITPRGIHELFRILDRDSGKCSFSVSTYMLELYQDELTDLLLPVPAKGQKASLPCLRLSRALTPRRRNLTYHAHDFPDPCEARAESKDGGKSVADFAGARPEAGDQEGLEGHGARAGRDAGRGHECARAAGYDREGAAAAARGRDANEPRVQPLPPHHEHHHPVDQLADAGRDSRQAVVC